MSAVLDSISTAKPLPLSQPAEAGHYDELLGADGLTRPHWKALWQAIPGLSAETLEAKRQALERQIHDNGVTYNVYADAQGMQRTWSVNLLPLMIEAQDWAVIEAGVLQRTRLLDTLMADLYGPQRSLREGLLPMALGPGHPGYLMSLHGLKPVGGVWLPIAAFDLARGADGIWRVVSHRCQAPSGLGYLLENRLAVSRQLSDAYQHLPVHRLADSYRTLVAGLQALSPKGRDARVALLTPGPFNETYFEHAYLASYLGLPLVEGHDLTVRGDRLYLKTLNGLAQVDILIKRLDDAWLDPLELRADSTLGVAGLMQVLRAGELIIANTPGSAPLESPALHGFLPGLSESLLGEALQLPSLPTWWCGEPASLADVLPRLSETVIRSTYPELGHEAILGPSLSASGLQGVAARIQSAPLRYTAQAYLPLSQNPAWRNGHIEPRSTMLRVFALADGAGSWHVLPGGLVRLAPTGQRITSMQRGGTSADCWVLSTDPTSTAAPLHLPSSLLRDAGAAGAAPQVQGPGFAPLVRRRQITSRVAENLFWLGRYTERADHGVRLARIILRGLQGDDRQHPSFLGWMNASAQASGLAREETPSPTQSRTEFEADLLRAMGPDSGACSLGFNFEAIQRAADQIRERLSPEHRQLIQRLTTTFRRRHRQFAAGAHGTAQALFALDEASETLAAITGAQTDRMVRDDGWRMLSIGRHIERLATLAETLRLGLECGSLQRISGFEAMLAVFDCSMTFHAEYQQQRDLHALIEMLVLHRDHPRALAWVTSTLRSRLHKLPANQERSVTDLLIALPDPDRWAASELSDTQVLVDLLLECRDFAWQLSEQLGLRYFSHADRVGRALVS